MPKYMLLALCLATAGTALAQHGGGGGGGRPMGGGSMGGMGGGSMEGPRGVGGNTGVFGSHREGGLNNHDQRGSMGSGVHAGLQVGPPTRWWDDKHFVKSLKLRPDQQKRMDSIFDQNKAALVKSYENVQQEEAHYDELTHAKTLDESALFAQIDRVHQALANLEKTKTHYLYQLRNEMDADQISRLEDER